MNSRMKSISNVLTHSTILPIFLFIFILCSIFVSGFLSTGNIANILLDNAAKGVLAVGMTFLIINGYFDLSVGTQMGLSAMILVVVTPHVGFIPAMLIVFAIGVISGIIKGYLVMKVGINAFIVTLALMFIYRSCTFLISVETVNGTSPGLYQFGTSNFLGLSNLVWVMLVLLAIGYVILKYTLHGRNTYACGGNAQAAANMGINVNKTLTINFILSSVSATVAAIMAVARQNSANPQLGWPDYHLLAITAVVLGGSKITGGFGNMLFTLGGIVTLGMINNAMNMLGVQSYYNTLVTGLILIIVMYMDKIIKIK